MEPAAHSLSPLNPLVSKLQPDSERQGQGAARRGGWWILNVCTGTNSPWVIPNLSYINFTASPCWGTQRCCCKRAAGKLRGRAELSACSPKRVIWWYQQGSQTSGQCIYLLEDFSAAGRKYTVQPSLANQRVAQTHLYKCLQNYHKNRIILQEMLSQLCCHVWQQEHTVFPYPFLWRKLFSILFGDLCNYCCFPIKYFLGR